MIANTFMHFFACFGVALVLALLFPRYRWEILILVCVIGMGKELGDLFVDERDLVSNFMGAATGICAVRE